MLRVEFPARRILTGPTPDILLTNPATGTRFLANVKAGVQAERMSVFSDAYIRAMRDAASVAASDVVLVTTAEPPVPVQANLHADRLAWWTVRTPEEALERLVPVLERLAGDV